MDTDDEDYGTAALADSGFFEDALDIDGALSDPGPSSRRRASASVPLDAPPYHTAPDDLGLAPSRRVVLRELLEQVPEVELEWFKDYALPRLHRAVRLNNVVDRLTKPGKHCAINEDGYWWLWKNYPMSALNEKENPTFRPIEQLALAICDAAEVPKQPTVKFVCLPDKNYKQTVRHNTSKPDGAAVLVNGTKSKKSSNTIKWVDVAAPAEFKHKSNDDLTQDNRTKILWSLAYILREDPRRRFVIGYTIEDVSMRLWFASRSDVFVSKPFDFMKDHRSTIHFILSLAYATEAQLGWDDSIRLSNPRNYSPHATFHITVRDKDGVKTTYRTKKLLSNLGAEAVRGRGTRVWLVCKLDKGGKPETKTDDHGQKVEVLYVLKDCWIDDDRMSEGHIMDVVYSQEGVSDPRVVDRLKRYLLTTETHGRVYVGKTEDHTRNVMLKGQSVPSLHDTIRVPLETGIRAQVASNLGVQGSIAPEVAGPDEPPRYSGKVHYRIVYKEVGKTLRTVPSMSEVFGHLRNVAIGVSALYARGWIHRDISVGNVLVVNGTARLSDLEYAKPVLDNQQPHGIRTGTIFFMSTEVENHEYLHWKAPVRKLVKLAPGWMDDPPDQVQQGPAQVSPPPPPKTPPPNDTLPEIPFRHNGLHDAESVFWLALYLLLVCVLVKPDRQTTSQYALEQHNAYQKAQRRLAALIFGNQGFRGNILSVDNFLVGKISNLHPRVCYVIKELDEVRKQIVEVYERAERSLDREPHTPDLSEVEDLLGNMAMSFTRISAALRNDDIVVETGYRQPHKASGQLKEAVKRAAKASRRAESPPAGADAPGSKRQRVAGSASASQTAAAAAASSSASGSRASEPGPSNSQSSTAGPSGAGSSSTAAALQADNMKTPTKPRRSRRTAKGAK